MKDRFEVNKVERAWFVWDAKEHYVVCNMYTADGNFPNAEPARVSGTREVDRNGDMILGSEVKE